MLYGVLTKCNSFNTLCKNLHFLDKKLTSIGIEDIPARSTISDANINRDAMVFERLYNVSPRLCILYLSPSLFSAS